MKQFLKEFWEEEEAFGTVELVMLIAALIVVALTFREQLGDFVTKISGQVFKTDIEDLDSLGPIQEE